jgi:hypothetical protein
VPRWLLHDLWLALLAVALVPLAARFHDWIERWGAPEDEPLPRPYDHELDG